MSTADFDPVIQSPTRLSIMALLAQLPEAEFGLVRDRLDMTDSALSKQITQLHDAGYLQVRKGYVGKRPRTWVSLTSHGRHCLDRHVAALKSVIAQVEGTPATRA